MSIYHLHCDIIGRSGGRSATAAAAYRATEKIEDITTGEIFDFTRKEKSLYSEILSNCELPQWARTRAELWNEVEKKENRKNSQFARSFDIALQKELSIDENIECVKKWIKNNYTSRGLVADLNIHAPHKLSNGESNENIHAHVMITTRKMTADGWGEKDREGNDREFLKAVRTSWANIVNAKFKENGINEHIDERTLEEQGIDREPQQHLGAKATAMQRKGKTTDRQKFKSEQEIIVITQEEIQKELENDNEYKHLQELLKNEKTNSEEVKELKNWIVKIQEMSPKEWQSFTKNMDCKNYVYEAYGEYTHTIMRATQKAKLIWIEKNIKPITTAFEKNYKITKSEYEKYLNKRPREIAEKPNSIKAFFYNFETDKGNVFSGKNYDAYRSEQQRIITDWEHGKSKPQNSYEVAKNELKDCYDKKYNEVRIAIERHHPSLLEQMKTGANDLFMKLKDFRPVRAMIRAVREFKQEKDLELKEYQRANKRNKEIDRDTGYSL